MDVHDSLMETLDTSKRWADELLKDISEEDSLATGADGLNHIKWQVGHLCRGTWMIADALGSKIEFDDAAKYKELFDWSTLPSSDASVYPPLTEITGLYADFHKTALDAIGGLSDDDLVKELQITDEWKEQAWKFVIGFAQHQAYHVGQVAAIRTKVLQRKGLFG